MITYNVCMCAYDAIGIQITKYKFKFHKSNFTKRNASCFCTFVYPRIECACISPHIYKNTTHAQIEKGVKTKLLPLLRVQA